MLPELTRKSIDRERDGEWQPQSVRERERKRVNLVIAVAAGFLDVLWMD